MSIATLMNSTCDVYTLSTSQDGAGGVNESYSEPARMVDEPCRIRQLRGDERIVLGREGLVADYRIYFRAGTDIRMTDRVTNVKRFLGNQQIATDTNNYDFVVTDDPNRMGKFVQGDLVLRQQARISTSG